MLFCSNQVSYPDQAWFWTEGWQKLERKAQADIEAGRVYFFDDLESALSALDQATAAGKNSE